MLKEATKPLIIKSLLTFLVGVILLFQNGILKAPYIDNLADKYFKESITKAGLAYATVRVINATVSIIQESKLQLEPAGVGVSLAVGQVLDPINDMTERLSDILVFAITSLGVQKLSFEIAQSIFSPFLGIILLVFSALIWLRSEKLQQIQTLLFKLSLILLVARVCLPLSSLANEYLYTHFFAPKIESSRNALELGVKENESIGEINLPQSDGVFSALSNTKTFIELKSKQLKNALVYTMQNASLIIENLLALSFLYIGLFILQILLLPLGVFYLLYKLLRESFLK